MQIIDLLNKCFNPKVTPRSCPNHIVPRCNYDSKIIVCFLTKTTVDKNCHKEAYKVKGI